MIKSITKRVIFLLTLLFTSQITWAQWTALNVTDKNIEGIYAIESHNGILFASSNPEGLIQSTDNGTTWTAVGQTGFTTNPNSRRVEQIVSTGSDLYVVTFYAFASSSMIYKSSDNGKTFTPDTVGFPKEPNSGECANTGRFYYNDGYLYAEGGFGNYMKSPSGDWVKNNSQFTVNSSLFAFYDDASYAWGNYKLAISSNNGQTWNETTSKGLPNLFLAKVINVNPKTGRIYIAGKSIINDYTRLMYSDDEGENWDSIPMAQYIGKNWLGQQQNIVAMYSNGENLFIGLDNDANSTAADILKSTDGGTTFTADITGLHSDAGQTTQARDFALHNGYLFMALNYRDIYRKGLFVGIDNTTLADKGINVYPNPANNILNISFNQPFTGEIKVYTTYGQELSNYTFNNGMIDISTLPAGMYLIKVTENNVVTGTQIFIKQ